MAVPLPAKHGERLLPSLVDELAESNPERILYSVPKGAHPADGFQDINAKVFSQAVNICAWHIAANIGPGHGFPTLTYMGPQDLIYGVLILACNKTGYKLLLNSLRNPLSEHLALLEKMDCNTFLLPSGFSLPMVRKILATREMRVLEIPTMKELFLSASGSVKPYPYAKTFIEAKLDPFVVLHTSGSTGSLKPVIQTHATIAPMDAFMDSTSKPPPYPVTCTGKRLYVTFPLFHCAGIHMILPGPIYCDYTVVLGPYPPSADIVNGVHVHGNVQSSCLAAITLIDLAKRPDYLENLRGLEHVAYGGGPCPQAVGDLVATKTKLMTAFGTTEAGAMATHFCDDPKDWAYIKMDPLVGLEYRPVSENLYEQVIVRNPELERYQGVFGTFPELQEWLMKDLYSPHPTKSGIWMYQGRVDDVIVYSTGEKLNPLKAESIIGLHPAVQGVLVTGKGRTQSSLLIEPKEAPMDEAQKCQLLESIWPSVELANMEIPSHGRIHYNMVLFTQPQKPVLRAGKGTIQRNATVDLYAEELDALYRESEKPVNSSRRGTQRSSLSIQSAIRSILSTSTEIEVATIGLDVNLFEQGLDSLQVTLIVKETNDYLSTRGSLSFLNSRTVYANPTLRSLTAAVLSIAEGKLSMPEHTAKDTQQRMQQLFDANARELPLLVLTTEQNASNDIVILLTGSTGSLGSYLLDLLITDSRVSKIYCLNRGSASHDRQIKSQDAKGLQSPRGAKVECLDADLARPYLGLMPVKYAELLKTVTNIIHGAWQVDFNLTVESFSLHIAGVRSLVNFSALSTWGAEIFFLSSVGAVANWQALSGLPRNIPEETFADWRVPDDTGYAQSKFISECLLDVASKESGIPSVICRIGQIAGPTAQTGVWPKKEWLPSLLRSSKHIGKLPNSLGRLEEIDWVPVNLVAQCILELAIRSRSKRRGSGALVYHVINPERSTWLELLPCAERLLGIQETVPLEAWLEALRESASQTADLTQNPGVKLLDFFNSLGTSDGSVGSVNLSTTHTMEMSRTLMELGPVRSEWLENWIRQWGF